jgi:TetR/AcrR family transcriptional regulator, tetracycline repressor protein
MTLDRETVVRTALRVLDEAGLEGLTLRKIAGELGVQAPALYWHFKNKQELLDEMATTVFSDAMAEVGLGPDEGAWSEWALQYAEGLRRTLLRYRDGARIFSGTYLTDAAMYAGLEAALRRLTAAGFSLREAVLGLSTIYCYVVGFTIEEQAVHPRPGEHDPRYDLATRADRIDGERFPLAQAAGAGLFASYDERFAQGVALIVRGLRPQPGG